MPLFPQKFRGKNKKKTNPVGRPRKVISQEEEVLTNGGIIVEVTPEELKKVRKLRKPKKIYKWQKLNKLTKEKRVSLYVNKDLRNRLKDQAKRRGVCTVTITNKYLEALAEWLEVEQFEDETLEKMNIIQEKEKDREKEMVQVLIEDGDLTEDGIKIAAKEDKKGVSSNGNYS